MLAADLCAIDGSNNNLSHPDWGSAGEQLLRLAPAEYADGANAPAGADRASARAISDLVVAQTDQGLNDRGMSAFIYVWGQFLDHDIDLTPGGNPAESMPVAIPSGDSYFDPQGTGTQTMPMSRSIYDSSTGTSAANPRQQINVITAFIDGSQVYGSDATRAAALRTFSGGRLKTSAGDLLPLNTMGLANDNALGLPAESLFVAGDARANENIELTAIQTLFVREHNRLADKYAALNPTWTDEQIYQQARRIVIGELQAITYNEFLPALLGAGALPSYRGYNPRVNPGIANEFSTAAFRLGHSLLGNDVEFLDNQGLPVHDDVELRDTFFNPSLLKETGIDGVFKYLASDVAQEVDVHIVDEVRNFLFGPPGSGGMDLAALNIQRGRDHGLADYNAVRVAYGLQPVTRFSQITSDVPTQQALQAAYGDVNNIDLWVGALAEDHLRGASVGPLLSKILVDQFTRLRDGDRFWYQRDLSATELRGVLSTSLADIIRLNTTTKNLQPNVFFFTPSISGQVFLDSNANGRQDRRESPLRGITVQLLDADDNVIATTVTGRDGSYSFKDLDLGTYRVRLSLPAAMVQTTRAPRDISITRDIDLRSIDFGIRLQSAPFARM